jgi:hypothetical protein
VRVDHSGAAPVLVIGGQRFTMDDLRAAAAHMPIEVRVRIEQVTAGEEFVHALIAGDLVGDE